MSLARIYALSLKSSGFTDDIDTIIPVPLHPAKKRSRGFNQSEYISSGISDVTGLPVNTKTLIRASNFCHADKKIAVRQVDKC